MCCFSRPVDLVANTNLFARSSKEGRQFVVYSMTLSAKEDLAMILPLPTPKNAKEDAVKFINLEKYADFFKDLFAGFPLPKSVSRGLNLGEYSGDKKPEQLKVVEVGSFEASFVPSVKDFARLDERFRLPTDVWDKLPQYKEFGFTVFKLKKGASKVHPMAFEFPRANAKQLFFPTVHIHDGKVHEKASFDHWLYCQKGDEEAQGLMKWEESPQPAGLFMKLDQAQGLLLKEAHCYRLRMKGQLKNEDVLV
jgi:hypothetical protein